MSARVSRGLRQRVRTLRARPDAGMSIAELLVAMVLSTILGTITLSLALSVDSSTAATNDRALNSSAARNTLQAWTNYLRVADGPTPGSRVSRIEWLTDHDMLFYADLNNRSLSSAGTTGSATMVWLRRDSAGRLLEEFFAQNAPANATPTSCRTLTLGAAASTTRLFTAVDSSGATMSALNLGAAPTAAAGCVPLPVTVPSRTSRPDLAAQSNLQNVFSVTIDFVLRDSRGGHPLEFTSQAVLPALGSVS